MYIDTSCLAAYYLPEKKSQSVQLMLQDKEHVTISYLTEVELLSAIKKKQRMGELSKKDGNASYKLFKKHRRSGFYKIAELSPSVFQASEWILEATKSGLRTLDAIHLGIVYEYKLDLYTFDRTLAKSAAEFNIKTL